MLMHSNLEMTALIQFEFLRRLEEDRVEKVREDLFHEEVDSLKHYAQRWSRDALKV
jgi:hypothetical protein